jgi:hypothetical protein
MGVQIKSISQPLGQLAGSTVRQGTQESQQHGQRALADRLAPHDVARVRATRLSDPSSTSREQRHSLRRGRRSRREALEFTEVADAHQLRQLEPNERPAQACDTKPLSRRGSYSGRAQRRSLFTAFAMAVAAEEKALKLI